MEQNSELLRPNTLMAGEKYVLWERRTGKAEHTLIPVRLIKYDPCPAFVIMSKETGQRIRCTRDDIFLYAE